MYFLYASYVRVHVHVRLCITGGRGGIINVFALIFAQHFPLIKIVRVSLKDEYHVIFNWLNRRVCWFLRDEFELPATCTNISLMLST